MTGDARTTPSEFYPAAKRVSLPSRPDPTVVVANLTDTGSVDARNDTREDVGEFYPGGRIVTAVPQRRQDAMPLDGETLATNTIPSLRDAIRRIGTALGATVSCVLFAVAVEVQSVKMNEIDFDADVSVVTNVTGVVEMARQVASNETAIATKADAEKTVSISTGGASTNLVVRPVYANVNLVIREVETANGQRQFRLIRREDD